MGSKEAGEMQFWTKDEYLRFSDAISGKPLAFYAFEVLYWMGIRCGELMALTPSDFLMETSELRINKSYQRLRGEDVVTKPKTRKSVRTIKMPAFLRDEMAEFIEMRDDVAPDERLLAVCDADELDADLQKQLALVMKIFNGFGEAPPSGKRATREKGSSDVLFGMSRR